MKRIVILAITTLLTLTTAQTFAQNKAELKQQKVTEQESKIKSLLESGSYRFVADRANTTLKSKPYVNLDGTYGLTVNPDKLTSYLPFYGRAYSAPIGSSESPLDFASKDFKSVTKLIEKKKSNLTRISFEAKSEKDHALVKLILEVYPNGSATLDVDKSGLSRMYFFGKIEEVSSEAK